MTDPYFAAAALRPRPTRGLTLIECAIALVIVALAVTLVLQTDIGTTETALYASNSQLAALLANEIMALEAMGEMPQEPGATLDSGDREVERSDERFADPDTHYFPYSGFRYRVIKSIVEISDETDMSANPEEAGPGRYGEVLPEGEEPPLTIEVVRVRVIVSYPAPQGRGSDGGDRDEITLETYVFDTVRRATLAEQAGGEEE